MAKVCLPDKGSCRNHMDDGSGDSVSPMSAINMEVEITQPLNTFRVRIDSVQNPPDRTEYLWAPGQPTCDPAGGRGPSRNAPSIYQDLRFQLQTGGEKFSVATEIPIRLVDRSRTGIRPAWET